MNIKVCGPRLLVKPFKLEVTDEVYRKAKAAGIHIAESDDLKREKAALDRGVVLEVGELAWKDWPIPTPWCKKGDKIVWARHSGKLIEYDEKTDERTIIISDEDVIAVLGDTNG